MQEEWDFVSIYPKYTHHHSHIISVFLSHFMMCIFWNNFSVNCISLHSTRTSLCVCTYLSSFSCYMLNFGLHLIRKQSSSCFIHFSCESQIFVYIHAPHFHMAHFTQALILGVFKPSSVTSHLNCSILYTCFDFTRKLVTMSDLIWEHNIPQSGTARLQHYLFCCHLYSMIV